MVFVIPSSKYFILSHSRAPLFSGFPLISLVTSYLSVLLLFLFLTFRFLGGWFFSYFILKNLKTSTVRHGNYIFKNTWWSIFHLMIYLYTIYLLSIFIYLSTIYYICHIYLFSTCLSLSFAFVLFHAGISALLWNYGFSKKLVTQGRGGLYHPEQSQAVNKEVNCNAMVLTLQEEKMKDFLARVEARVLRKDNSFKML